MHGPLNFKFVNAKQAKETYQYNNTKEKLCKTNATIWYNKIGRDEFNPDPAGKQSAKPCTTHTCWCVYNIRLLMMDKKPVRNM